MMEKELKNKILRERAKHYLKPRMERENAETLMNALVFKLSDEKYAIDSNYVKEVVIINELTPLPCTPKFVLGIINLRGSILSVIDIKKLFDLKSKGITNLNKVIIVAHDGIEFGVLADEISGHVLVGLEEIQKNSIEVTDKLTDYLFGVSDERLLVFDIKKLLLSDIIIVNEN